MNANFARRILDVSYFLRGERVWTVLNRIKKHQWLTTDSLREMQFQQVKKLLSHVFLHVPYYQRVMKEVGIHPDDIRSLDDFSQFPMLTKEEIKANWQYLMNHNTKVRTSLRQTSGSTGVPLRIFKDRQTTAVMEAAMYRSYSWHGISPGARQMRIWGTEIGALGQAKQCLKDLLLNRIRLSAFDLHKANFSTFLRRIDRFKPSFIYGYAQSVFEFAKFLVDEKYDLSHLNLLAAIVTGEMIFDWQKQVIYDAFNCPVVNEYGCTEVGIISIDCPSGNMHIISDILYVETVESEQLNDAGEGEILITELNNNYSPLIRYKVGDSGKLSNKRCPCGRGLPILSDLKGRSDDFIVFPSGKKVDPYILEYIIKEVPVKYGTVAQFMIIQALPSTLNIKLVSNSARTDKLNEAIQGKWKQLYGSEISLIIDTVNTLPKNPSGKLSCFKSLPKGMTEVG